MPDRPHLVIISGMAGAGRSLASNALEDLGFFVIDNLPADLIGQVVSRADLRESRHDRLAVVVDTRAGLDFEQFEAVVRRLAADGVPTTLIFLDADDEVLATRYRESRRPHPVPGATLADSIKTEREVLAGVRASADLIIDTSDTNVHELRDHVTDAFSGAVEERPMKIAVTSFGFKHGAPRVADLLFDVRFLPNPHWEEELRPLTGLDAAVSDHVIGSPDTREFLDRLEGLLGFLIPRYRSEGKSYLTIGIGCTGGRHRSVAIAEHLGAALTDADDVVVTVRHRDVAK